MISLLLAIGGLALLVSVIEMIVERQDPDKAKLIRLITLLGLAVIVMALAGQLINEVEGVFHVW